MKELDNEIRTMKDSAILKRTFQYIKPHIPMFLLSFLLMLIFIGVQAYVPILFGNVTALILDPAGFALNSVIVMALGYFGCVVGSLIFVYFNTMLLQKVGQKIVFTLRQEVFTHIESLSIAQINSTPVGKFVTRVTSDTNAVNDLYTNILVNLLKNAISVVVYAVMMFVLDWRIALVIMIFVPIVTILSFIFRKYSLAAYRDVRNNISAMNAFLSENISGIKITQIFNQEKRKEEEFDECNNKLKKAQEKQVFVFALFRPAIFVLYVFAEMIVLYLGFKRIGIESDIAISFNIVYSLYMYVSRFFQPIQTLADQFNGLQRCFAASERLFLLLDTKPDLLDQEDSIELENIKGEIEFKNVWFAYKEEEWILKDVSFKVNPKETVAFVGATGAGKTTILSLIVRNYEIQKGQILIDGIDIKHIKIQSLRRNIGQMLQDVFLFSGILKENISLRDDSINDAEIEDACKYVGADTFINKLDNKYDYVLQERGANFSSGQRQLISFARTIVHKPKIMILDEATSNIDTETEKLIQSSLNKMMNIGTMLIVAHRLSTIQHADKIIVLQKGEIIESGTHQELLKKKGYYYNLYRLQYEGDR
ncbi:MAG: ABC transporter ATP-binding protein [Traorella sp.]